MYIIFTFFPVMIFHKSIADLGSNNSNTFHYILFKYAYLNFSVLSYRWTCANSCPSGWWCLPTISSSVILFSSHLQSFPASGSFPMSQLFASGGQSIGVSASASVLPMNTQDWSPLGWTGWISLQSKGLSGVFSNTTVQKHQFFSTQLSLQSNYPIHTWLLKKP